MFRFMAFLVAVTASAYGATVTLNTTGLIGSSLGPFTLDFQFIDGNGTGDGNNSVTLSNFSLSGGSINTTPTSSSGGVLAGSGPFTVGLFDTFFLTDVQFSFTPGNSLIFNIAATSNPDVIAPDTFTFAILDQNGNEIATTNPNGFNSFLELDLPAPGSGLIVITSGSAAGSGVNVPAPTYQTGGPTVPEPSTMLLLATGLAALTRRRRRRS